MTKLDDDILGTKTLAKVVDKTADGVGAFFSAICMPAAEEFGLYIRDHVAAYRLKNLENISKKAKELIENQNITTTGDASPKVLKEIIEESSWTDDEQVQRMWAGLIAISSGNTKDSDDSLVYIETLKKLTSFQARIINLIYGDPRCCSIKQAGSRPVTRYFNPDNQLVFSVPELLKQYPGNLTEIVPIANSTEEEILLNEKNHGIAISRFKPQLDALSSFDLLANVEFYQDNGERIRFTPTYQGLDFYMRCLGYSVYPIEAFLLTLQHWCSLKGIDPFTYDKYAT
ncbi:MAG: DUF4393 domain-containing protein [Gammaproteobacteria bacterium]|nr:DUF4393 domain-containing protein [Gammaproteobacteria bacterium]